VIGRIGSQHRCGGLAGWSTCACVTTLAATLSYTKVGSSVAASVNKATSTSAPTTGSLFRYAGSQYIFNWGTKGLTAGAYLLQIDLGDGVTRTVTVGLK
jgi:hypothetical protein